MFKQATPGWDLAEPIVPEASYEESLKFWEKADIKSVIGKPYFQEIKTDELSVLYPTSSVGVAGLFGIEYS